MNIRTYKYLARGQMAERRPIPVLLTSLLLLIGVALVVLSMKLCGYLDYVRNVYGNVFAELSVLESQLEEGADPAVVSELFLSAFDTAMWETPVPELSGTGLALSFAVLLMLAVFRAGHTCACLCAARNKVMRIRMLWQGFENFFRVAGVYLVRILLTAAGLLLLVLPGLYAWYRYRFATFVLADHPDWGVFRILHEAAKLSRGRIVQLVVLDLSFLGWMAASYFATLIIAVPIMETWYRPFMKICRANCYLEALGEQKAEEEDSEPV